LNEERRTAAWFDEYTATIDRLIKLRQKQVELLASNAQSRIHHTIAHGLNQTARSSDLRIAWLDPIPAHG
jgi:hypothetical protein